MGCSPSVTKDEITKPMLLEPQVEGASTERPGLQAENVNSKPFQTPDSSNIRVIAGNAEASKPPNPLKKGHTDSGILDSNHQQRSNQALKIQNMPIIAKGQPGKLPAGFMRNRQGNLLETVRNKQSKNPEIGSSYSIPRRNGGSQDKSQHENENNDGMKSMSKADRAKQIKNQQNPPMSRQSSREQSVGPNSNNHKNMAKATLNGEERSESDQDKSPFKFNNPKQASIFQRQGQANILDNIGGKGNFTYIRYNTTDHNKRDQDEDHSVANEQSNPGNATLLKPYTNITTKQSGSLFKQQAEATSKINRNKMMMDMRARNFTTGNPAMNAKQSVMDDEDDDSDFENNQSNMNNRKITRRERKLYTNVTVKPSVNEYSTKYRMISWIANGSYATVERCQRKSDCAEYVMKYMKVRDIADKIIRLVSGLSQAEAQILAKELCDNEINISELLAPHPNISTIDDSYFDKIEGSYRLFSQFAQHGTLMSNSHISYVKMMSDNNETVLSLSMKKSLFRDIVRGLQHMHHRGIVHRDIKCENILIFEDGSAKLTDFSVSLKADQTNSDLLKLGTTKICQSPEMWENSNYVDFPHDIWSLGVVLWELVFAKQPFNTTGGEATFKQEVLSFTPVFPDESIEDSLKELLLSLLQQDPSKRWTIDQVAKSLWLS